MPVIRRNSKHPSKKWEADFQFRRKQSLTASAKSFKAVGQTGMPSFKIRVPGLFSIAGTQTFG
jgi:hypothetical protein